MVGYVPVRRRCVVGVILVAGTVAWILYVLNSRLTDRSVARPDVALKERRVVFNHRPSWRDTVSGGSGLTHTGSEEERVEQKRVDTLNHRDSVDRQNVDQEKLVQANGEQDTVVHASVDQDRVVHANVDLERVFHDNEDQESLVNDRVEQATVEHGGLDNVGGSRQGVKQGKQFEDNVEAVQGRSSTTNVNNILPDHCRISKSQRDFQVIVNNTAFVYTAYIDDRPSKQDGGAEKKVVPVFIRVFTYFLRGIEPKTQWRCVLWYPERKIEGEIVNSPYDVVDHKYNPHVSHVISMVLCALPDTDPEPPCAVSLVTSDWQSGTRPVNIVPVVDLRDTRERNLASPSVNFTICVPPIHGTQYNWANIVEFIEVNRILGVDKFIFFDTPSTPKDVRECLRKYTSDSRPLSLKKEREEDRTPIHSGVKSEILLHDNTDDMIEVYPWSPPIFGDHQFNNYGQWMVVTECVYRTMYRTRYLSMFDLDELIVPLRTNSWQEMIESFQTIFNEKKTIAAYSFRNVIFPTNQPLGVNDVIYSKNPVAVKYNINALLKTTANQFIFTNSIRSKLILRPELVAIGAVHWVERFLDPNRSVLVHVHAEDALVFHYRDITHTTINITSTEINRRLHQYAVEILERVSAAMERYRPTNIHHVDNSRRTLK